MTYPTSFLTAKQQKSSIPFQQTKGPNLIGKNPLVIIRFKTFAFDLTMPSVRPSVWCVNIRFYKTKIGF